MSISVSNKKLKDAMTLDSVTFSMEGVDAMASTKQYDIVTAYQAYIKRFCQPSYSQVPHLRSIEQSQHMAQFITY